MLGWATGLGAWILIKRGAGQCPKFRGPTLWGHGDSKYIYIYLYLPLHDPSKMGP